MEQPQAEQPAHLWAAPNGRTLYAINWIKHGTVSAYRINRKTGALTLLNKVSAHGDFPNQIVLDPSGRIAVIANHDTGNFVAYKVLPDGKLGEAFFAYQDAGKPLSGKQPGPLAHGIVFSPDDRFMYLADLGLDRVYGYKVDLAKATITPGATPYVETPAGSGPRRLQISPDGKFLYVNHQDDSKVSVFAVDGTTLTPIQIIATIPPNYVARNTTAEIIIDRPGKHLYVSNRGRNSIAIYDIDQTTGRLTLKADTPAGGNIPRNLRLDSTGDYLLVANQGAGLMATTKGGGNVVAFRIDHATGLLTETGATGEINNAAGVYAVAAAPK